jgi:heme exporter protein D
MFLESFMEQIFTAYQAFLVWFAMGNHGVYVWTCYSISLAVLALNVVLPILARRRFLQDEARRMRREELK